MAETPNTVFTLGLPLKALKSAFSARAFRTKGKDANFTTSFRMDKQGLF
jgi:hypothetical protein